MSVERLFIKYCMGYLAIGLLYTFLSLALEFISEDVFVVPLLALAFVSVFYPPFAISKIYNHQLGGKIWPTLSKVTLLIASLIIAWISFEFVFAPNSDPWRGLLFMIVTLLAGVFLSCLFVGYAATSNRQYKPIRRLGLVILTGSVYSILVFLSGIFELHSIRILNPPFYWPAGITVVLALVTLLLTVFVGLKPEFKNEKGRMLDAAS